MTTERTQTWKDLLFWRSIEWSEIRAAIAAGVGYITPEPRLIFKPLVKTRLSDVKVVLLQPEPYYKNGVADGLAFSFNGDIRMAPVPFYFLMRALEHDVGVKAKRSDLSKWGEQGVLLWNCIPTTYKNTSGVHQQIGWEKLTREIIETVYLVNPKTIFVSFGNTTRDYLDVLPEDANIIDCPAPHNAKLEEVRLFSTINKRLNSSGVHPVNWSV